jgi:hypothetical protein
MTRFSRQSAIRMSGKSRTDARFPYEYRQIVVVSLPLFLLWSRRSPVQVRAPRLGKSKHCWHLRQRCFFFGSIHREGRRLVHSYFGDNA